MTKDPGDRSPLLIYAESKVVHIVQETAQMSYEQFKQYEKTTDYRLLK